MAKAKKKAKKANNNRGNWSTRPITPLSFINVEKLQRGGDNLKISASGMYFSPKNVKQLDLTKGSFILVALDGKTIYIAKKPSGLFGGHKLSAGGKNSARLWANMKAKNFNLPLGIYELGKIVRTSLPDHNNKEISFEAYELVAL